MVSSIIWILIASLLGFAIAAVFAGWLKLILPHITMHIVAMMHGPKTTGQVPPHYDD